MIGDYAGTVLLISHDRDFLDRIVNAALAPDGNGKWLEYAGGYSDMLAQRGADVRKPAAKPSTTPERKSAERPAAEPRRKLNFNEKHALENLPARMAKLETEVKRLNERLADPALYARDRAAFDKATAALATAQTDLAAAEERWLELELLRSELEGS
jgi:ABC transport system ATP-binding/permease protein